MESSQPPSCSSGDDKDIPPSPGTRAQASPPLSNRQMQQRAFLRSRLEAPEPATSLVPCGGRTQVRRTLRVALLHGPTYSWFRGRVPRRVSSEKAFRECCRRSFAPTLPTFERLERPVPDIYVAGALGGETAPNTLPTYCSLRIVPFKSSGLGSRPK